MKSGSMKEFQYYQIAIQRTLDGFIPFYRELFLRLYYFRRFGRLLALRRPRTFNEKLQWMKLFGNAESYAHLVDKVSVKQHIRQVLGDDYTIKDHLVVTNPHDIDLNRLPNQFVVKPNHLSGRVLVCREKKELDIGKLTELVNYWLKLDHYYVWFETSYKGIVPRIMFEELLTDGNQWINDYKFYCFNGRVEYIHVDQDRFSRHVRVMYSRDWERLPFSFNFPLSDAIIPRPERLPEMIEIAETLSQGFPFVRIDLYNADQGIKFGEFTFFPEAGFGRFDPPEWDMTFGSLFNLALIKERT